MCTCEFCHTSFQPRPQTKNPRACNNDRCQKMRQSDNERQWRQKHSHLCSSSYHRVRRKQRRDKIDLIISALIRCFKVGKDLLGFPISIDDLSVFITTMLSRLGIRVINKLWEVDLINHFEKLEGILTSQNLQTSSLP